MITLQFIPYYDIAELSSAKRVTKLLSIVKDNFLTALRLRVSLAFDPPL